MGPDQLEAAADAMERAAQAAGLAIYPAIVDLPDAALVAAWPGEEAEPFVSIGVASGARILYLHRVPVDEGLRAFWAGELGPHDPLLAKLDLHAGELVSVTSAWVLEGVVHTWVRVEPWWGDWVARAHQRAEEVEDELAAESAAHDRARIGELAELVAADPAFRRAGGPMRRGLCLNLIEFAVDRPRAVVGEVTEAAGALIDADAAPKARQLRAEGKPKKAIVAALDITESMLERYLTQPG